MKSNNIKDARTLFGGSGVLYELSKSLGEAAQKKEYPIYDLLCNIPCIHRTFSITYQCTELFIPIRDVQYMIDTDLKKGWVQFRIDERYANGSSLKNVPKSVEKVKYEDSNKYSMREKACFEWDIHGKYMPSKDQLIA